MDQQRIIESLTGQLELAIKTIASALSFRLHLTKLTLMRGDLIVIGGGDPGTDDLMLRASRELIDLLRWQGHQGVLVVPSLNGLAIDAIDPEQMEAHGWVRSDVRPSGPQPAQPPRPGE